MLLKSFLLFPVFLIIFVEICSSLENDPNRHIRELDPSGKYRLEWVVDVERQRILFNVTVQTLGFVGFGISKRANNGLTDLIVGGVDSSERAYFSDRNLRQNQFPNIDRRQDWILHSARESATHTFLTFSRLFDTCDPEDVPFDDDTVTIHWFYGESDNLLEYFRATRGTASVYLRDPDFIPRSFTEIPRTGEHPKEINGREVSVWNLNVNFTLPAKRTTYLCEIKKLSLRRKHHILGYNVRINKESLPHVHHIIFFHCKVPKNLDPSTVYEPYLNYQDECYSQGDQYTSIPTQYCNELRLAWAVGAEPTFLPDNVGIPIGESGVDEYYLINPHYDNPEGRNNIFSKINFDIYYTSQLRQNDGGLILIGAGFPGSPGMLIPPHEEEHRIFGHCGPDCTKKMINQEGIKIVGGYIHSHYAGRKLRLSHFRNGRELPFIFNDENYDITFQTYRMKTKEVVALPGDQLTMRCSYDTTDREKTTVGGFGSDHEMCMVFVFYYNKIDYPYCISELISPEYTAKYLAGASNLTWDRFKLEFLANAPKHLVNMTVTEISDSPYVNWNREQREQLRLDHLWHPQVEICLNQEEFTAVAVAQKAGEVVPVTGSLVSYPQIRVPYRDERSCPNYPTYSPRHGNSNFHNYNYFSNPAFRGYRNWHFK